MVTGSPLQNESLAATARLHAEDVVPSLPASENKKFYPALDGLRAIAVLMVFYQHYLGEERPSLSWGWTGVDLFFVLSGFLITGILFDTRYATHRFRDFYVRRILRIFPLYYAALLGGILLTPVFHWVWQPSMLLWPLYLGNYTSFIWLKEPLGQLHSTLATRNPFSLSYGHFWSLCVEEQFYLVWPLVVFYAGGRTRLRNICLVVVLGTLLARILCVFLIPQVYIQAGFLNSFTPLRSDALLLGGAMALMLRGPESATLHRILRPALVLFVIGFLVFEATYFHLAHHLYQPVVGAPVLDTIGYSLLDIFAGIVILSCLEEGTLLYRILTIKPLRSLGQISYGFYVFHDIPHAIYGALAARLFHGKQTENYTAAVALCATLALSLLSFRYFEAPFLRLKQRFAPS